MWKKSIILTVISLVMMCVLAHAECMTGLLTEGIGNGFDFYILFVVISVGLGFIFIAQLVISLMMFIYQRCKWLSVVLSVLVLFSEISGAVVYYIKAENSSGWDGFGYEIIQWFFLGLILSKILIAVVSGVVRLVKSLK